MYKVGNIVKIQSKKFLQSLPDYNSYNNTICVGAHFVEDMFIFCGKTFIITQVRKDALLDKGTEASRKIYGDTATTYCVMDDGISFGHADERVENYRFSSYMFVPIKTVKQLEFDF